MFAESMTNQQIADVPMQKEALAKRTRILNESQTIMMSKLSRELSAKGVDIINLSLGEPDFITPAHICEAAKKAIDDGFTHYTPIAGYLDLRKAISRKFKRENNLDYSPEQIIVSTGAKQAIANVVLSLVDEGDEVIIPAPYWVSYTEVVKLAGGKIIVPKTTIENDYKISPQQLEKFITSKTKLFIFSSPCNPTGSVYTRDELKALAAVLEKYPQVYILSDEIYEHINFLNEGKHFTIAEFERIREKVVIVNGVSKGYAMTGWRIGYIGAPKWIAAACDKIQGQITSGTSSISQKAAEAALDGDLKPTLEMRDAFLKRRDLVLKLMNEIPGLKMNKPDGAFYVFPDVSHFFNKSYKETVINNSTDLCMYLLNEGHVSVVTGEAFGAPECFRLSYSTTEEQLTEGVKRIRETLGKLIG